MSDLLSRARKNSHVPIIMELAARIEALETEVESLNAAGEREAVAWGERDQYLRTNVNLAIEIKDARKRIEALEAALREIVTTWDDPGRRFTMDALVKTIDKARAALTGNPHA